MSTLLYFSNVLVPALILFLVINGLAMKLNIFELFLEGVKEGLKIVLNILPTLIGLLMAVGVLKASEIFGYIGKIMAPVLDKLQMVPEMLSLMVVKLFSSSAATGLMLDIFNTYGVDSRNGLMAAVILSCTESCVYTMSVYFMSVKVTETRWTLAGALTAAFAGIAASVFLVGFM